MDRLHLDPTNQVMVDEAMVTGGKVSRAGVVGAVDSAYAIVGLRTAMRSVTHS